MSWMQIESKDIQKSRPTKPCAGEHLLTNFVQDILVELLYEDRHARKVIDRFRFYDRVEHQVFSFSMDAE